MSKLSSWLEFGYAQFYLGTMLPGTQSLIFLGLLLSTRYFIFIDEDTGATSHGICFCTIRVATPGFAISLISKEQS